MDDIDNQLFITVFGKHELAISSSEMEVADYLLGDNGHHSEDDYNIGAGTTALCDDYNMGAGTTALCDDFHTNVDGEVVTLISTSCNLDDFNVKSGAYTSSAQLSKTAPKDPLTLKDALALGFKLVKHDARTKLIADDKGRIMAAVVPPPDNKVYHKAAKDAFLSMKKVACSSSFQSSDYEHKRGCTFIPINTGLSYGIGHTVPSVPRLSSSKQKAVDNFIKSEAFQELASFQDESFAKWHPRAHQYYQDGLSKLWEHHPELSLPLFPESVMPTAAFNIGKNVFTKRHIDSQNCPFGWCLITALGDFDASVGGHIILWDLELIIEFPAGYCVCIPSALLVHSNIPVANDDQRMSFTQYCPGEIFRYIENWFMTDGQLMDISPAAMQCNLDLRPDRKTRGFDMFLNIDDVLCPM